MTKHRASERGLTLVEMMVVAAITTVVLIAAYEMMDGAVKASLFVEAHNDLPVFGQEVVNLMQREMMQSRQFFDGVPLGAGMAYFNALRTSGGLNFTTQQVPDSLMPIGEVTVEAVLPDIVGARFVGNCLLLARQLEPLTVPFDHDADPATADVQFPAERFEFQYYYLRRDTGKSFSGSGYFLDLMQARSNIHADFFQLSSLTVAQRANIAPRLLAAGVNLNRAWNPGAPVATAFYTLLANGNLNVINGPTIVMPRIRSLLPAMAGGRISGYMTYSVAIQRTPPYPFRMHRLPMYAAAVAGAPDYPQGFEVKITGPAGTRKAFVRLLLAAHYGVDKYDSAESTALTAVNF